MSTVGIGVLLLSFVIWCGLLGFRGQFWRCDQQLEDQQPEQASSRDQGIKEHPVVYAVIPARNEAEVLPGTLRSLFQQSYPNLEKIVVVDDHSQDETVQFAQQTAESLSAQQRLHVLKATSLPPGWTGKLWALEQGIQTAQSGFPNSSPAGSPDSSPSSSPDSSPKNASPDYILLTDADIEHDPENVSRLVAKAIQHDLDLVSVMVRLRCDSFWEQLLIPAFVFFFQKLYPFRWVNDPTHSAAAAAGGCILIRRTMLQQIGGLQAIRHNLIDDCALAAAVKARGGKIWLGLSDRTRSSRAYPGLQTIWEMVARTAFTQLHYSPLLLLGTLIGMVLIYLVAPIGLLAGILSGKGAIALLGLLIWLLMTLAYLPTVRFYRCSPLLAVCLPAIGLLYTLMTLDSALRHWRGQGGNWKGRVYPQQS